MARYFITTFDQATYHDEEGVEVADLAALRQLMWRSLTHIAHDESRSEQRAFSAEARDESGKRVLTGCVTVTLTETR